MKYRYTFECRDKDGKEYTGELVAGGAVSAMSILQDKLDLAHLGFANLVRMCELEDSVPFGIVVMQEVSGAKGEN